MYKIKNLPMVGLLRRFGAGDSLIMKERRGEEVVEVKVDFFKLVRGVFNSPLLSNIGPSF